MHEILRNVDGPSPKVVQNLLPSLASAAMIELTGRDLTAAHVAACVQDPGARVVLAQTALDEAGAARRFLEDEANRQIIYGVNTGFGPMASHVIARGELIDLQYNLIRSHAVGMGDPVDDRFVLAAFIARLNTLARGHSGVSPALLTTMAACINHRIVPIVPAHGAVGASGDLIQLAHIALALIGEGEVRCRGARMSAREALEIHGIAPHALGPKEGLSLINGTSFMTGIAALTCVDAQRLLTLALRTGAFALEIAGAFADGLSPELHDLRPHPGQVAVAAELRQLLAGSERLQRRDDALARHTIESGPQRLEHPVQEAYSLRCIPQVVGPVHETLAAARARVDVELNAVTDNPIVLREQGRFVHGGNFHGDYIATAMDQLKAAMVKLTLLSERRINGFLHPSLSRGLPPFLNLGRPGLTLGLQGLQFVATSTTAHSQTLAFPQAVHSIPTNGDNQDVVSLGTEAALLAARVVDNAAVVLAIEAVVLAQAADHLGVAGALCSSSQALYRLVRTHLAVVREDRVIHTELAALLVALRARPPSHAGDGAAIGET